MPERRLEHREPVSRRAVIKGLAALAVAMTGCTAPTGQTRKTAPPTTPTPPGRLLLTYRGHTARVMTVAWSPGGQQIASGSLDKSVQIWDAGTGTTLYTYRGYHPELAKVDQTKGVQPDEVFAVAWSHNGKRIAAVTQVYCGDECGVVVTWDARTGGSVTYFPTLSMFALCWTPDDTRLVAADGDMLAQVFAVS